MKSKLNAKLKLNVPGIKVAVRSWRRALCLFTVVLAATSTGYSQAQQSSSSLLLGPDQRWLFSANFDAGTLTRLDVSSAEAQQEVSLGGDIRRLAITDDSKIIAASDYLRHRIYLLDAVSLKVIRQMDTGRRPFGIVFDARRQWFWASLFEDHQLIAFDRQGNVQQRVTTADTPRGLALTDDGRLLVTHAMTGQLSIYDSRSTPLKLLQRISLAVEQQADEFASQGLPRLLDDIAISPDGREAWLPHLLWNFDHPFQFQSTVFPAVSIIDLTPGQEKEQVSLRKQLFKQINIIDNRSRTQIVSNPADAEFSVSGKKLYLTLAGSEDLLVFDLSRRASADSKRSKRRQGKLNQGGAKATQLLRHLPGDNPRGLRVNGEHLYVQNAMSQDIVLLERGGDGPFARVRIKQAAWRKTVAQDPLAADLRAGTRLFHNANSDDFPQLPMAGDFWMSCNSCHLDGFNFTNRYLMEANGRDKHQDAQSGHKHLKGMIAGQHLNDFLRIIQQTQGGMGHDDRDQAEAVDADRPPAQALTMMRQLNLFVRRPENLPFLATWLRVDSSADQGPYLHPEAWINSANCRQCHSDLFEQWADSNHRLMGESNPYFKVLLELAGETEGEGFKAWCLGCHMPHSVTTGNPALGTESHLFEKAGASLIEAEQQRRVDLDEGTGCLFCHRIVAVEDAGGNAALRVDLENRERYWLEQSDSPLGRWLGQQQINARPEVHARSYMLPVYKDPKYCQACHDEFSPGLGADIVDTYGEWQQSSYNNPEDPSRHRSCIDCHMHGDIERIGQPVPGVATDGGALQPNLVTHHFSGANHHLVGLRNPTHEAMSLQLLRSAATLEQRLENGRLVVRVNNTGAGHALPTGVADFRQFWLQVRITDNDGRVLLDQGNADADGHLPEDTRLFMKVFGDSQGNPLGLKFWRYEQLLSDTRIPADGYRDEAFDLPSTHAWPIHVQTRLLFRIYPQWVTDAVRQSIPELPEPAIVELQRIDSEFLSPSTLAKSARSTTTKPMQPIAPLLVESGDYRPHD